MALNNRVLSNVVRMAIALAVLVLTPAPGWAAPYQPNQAIQQPASLIAPKPEAKISIYPEPGTQQRRIGYGKSGDAVTVIERVGGNQGIIWNHIRFEASPYAEGWVQDQFLSFPGAERSKPQNQRTNQGDRYLGNLSPQSPSPVQHRDSFSSQRNQYQ
jgi:hypothetical protein